MTHTAELKSTVVKPVACEECGTQYVYFMELSVKGYAMSLFGGAAADGRAVADASKRLQKKADRECDVAPCPECGWLQQDMVRQVQRHRHRWLGNLGWILAVASFFVGLLNSGLGRFPFLAWPRFVLLAATGPLLLVLRAGLANAVDPNAGNAETRIELGRALSVRGEDREKMAAEGWLATSEVAAELRISEQRFLAQAEAHGVEGRQVGNAWLWPPGTVKRPYRHSRWPLEQ